MLPSSTCATTTRAIKQDRTAKTPTVLRIEERANPDQRPSSEGRNANRRNDAKRIFG
jgi:hypothetical protein